MGLRHFREKFSDIDIVYFFMPPVLHVSMPEAIARQGIIPEDKICKICKKNLQATIREATSILQEQREGEKGAPRKEKEEEEENGTRSKGKNQLESLWVMIS